MSLNGRDREEQMSADLIDAHALGDTYPTLVAALIKASYRLDAYLFPHGRQLSEKEQDRLVAAFDDVYHLRAELGLES